MKNTIRGTLDELGYNVNLKGAGYVEEIICQMLGFINSEDQMGEIKRELEAKKIEAANKLAGLQDSKVEKGLLDELLKVAEEEISDSKITHEMLSRIHLDAYHFEYEIGRVLYLTRIDQFLNSIKDQGQKSIDLELSDCHRKTDEIKINNAIMGLVCIFNNNYESILEEKRARENEGNKVYINRFDSIVTR